MLSDTKKCQTLINVAAEAAQAIQVASAKLQACRAAYVAVNPNPAGTPLAGNVQAVSTWIDGVAAVANAAVADAMIAAYVPTHRGAALEVQ